MTRVVQVANFVTPRSGGLRTALRHLAEGYGRAGHEVVQVLPGAADAVHEAPWGRVVHVAAPEVPGTGYRVLTRPRALARTVRALDPDRVEVHDRLTLRALGRRVDAPSLVVSHERLDVLLGQWSPGAGSSPAGRALVDRSNARLADGFDSVVCTTRWAAEEFTRLGRPVHRVPLGVDLARFTPDARSQAVHDALTRPGEALLLMATRLSREKAPELAVDAVAALVARGVRVRLVVAGDGPMRAALRRRSAGLPVSWLGHVAARDRLAELLASADVVLAPGPVETFGLAALEALASGTPVVARASSALPEVLGQGAGLAVDGTPAAVADAVGALLARPGARAAARARAERYPWSATVEGFLAVHRLHAAARVAA